MTTNASSPDVAPLREASRKLVRELGFMKNTLAGTNLPPSAVHALLEISQRKSVTSTELCDILTLEKSSVSRMVRKLVEAGELVEAVSEFDGRARLLSLTEKGHITTAAIDAFAEDQVIGALQILDPAARDAVLAGLTAYAAALEANRTGKSGELPTEIAIETGYRAGTIGRAVEMHARYYGRAFGFGSYFEAKVAAELAAFVSRPENARDRLWVAVRSDSILGTIAIDGQDMGPNIAHLR